MNGVRILAAAACILAAASTLAAPAKGTEAETLGPEALAAGTWFLSLSPGARDELRFFAIDPADADHLYLRRFVTPSFYLDALSGDDLKVLLWPEVKTRSLSFAPDNASFMRETSPIKVEYRRSPATPSRRSASPYEGDWEIGEPVMTVSIRACERRAWKVVMYFPGDPLSAIPMGYYPLYPSSDGIYRSSSSFPDSDIELSYDPASESLVIRPLFMERPLAAELYDPVHAWRGK
jgi:hypothetical protein